MRRFQYRIFALIQFNPVQFSWRSAGIIIAFAQLCWKLQFCWVYWPYTDYTVEPGPPRLERLAGAWGKFFFRGPYFKFFFRKKVFSENNPPVDNFLGQKFFQTSTLQLLSRDFIPIFHAKFRYLAQKTDILSWGPTKKFQGPPAPRGPGQFAPPVPPPLGGPE
jgi:hypothetical protein